MADKKITQLTELAVRPDYNIDVIVIVDSGSATSATKKISRHNFIPELNVTTGSATASKALVLDENSDIKDLRTVSASVTSTASFGRFMAAGNSNFSGNITIGGNLNIGDANTDYVVVQADLSSSLTPNNDNAFNIGSTSKAWKNIYFKSNISGSSATTASFGALAAPGGVLSTLSPTVSDGAALGTTSKMWSDLFLASAGVVNFNNGDVTLTHTSNKVTIAGGSLDVDDGIAIDNITIDGTEIDLSSGDLTIDVAGDINLDADGGDVTITDAGVGLLTINATKISGSSASTGSFGRGEIDGVLNATTIQQGGVDMPDGDAVSGSFPTREAVSGSFAQKSAVSGSLGLVAGVNTGTTVISGSVASTGSVGHLFVADDALVTDRIYLKDFGGEYISGDGTDLNLTSGADINIPSSIGLTFGNDGEKIEGNGTRLSIASGTGLVLDCEGDIEINADGGDVVVKDNTAVLLDISATDISGSSTSTGSFGKIEGDGSAITNLTSAAITAVANDAADRVMTMDGDGTATAEASLTFDGTILSGSSSSTGSFGHLLVADDGIITDKLYFKDLGGEYIYGDGTDLHIVAGSDINLPADVGLTFGGDGEKIESNGTRLSIASGTGMVLDCEGDIEINADGGDVAIKDGGAALLNISATKISGSAVSTASFGRVDSTSLFVTSSGQSVIQVGNTGDTLSKWEFHRNGTRQWAIYNDGRSSNPDFIQDGLHFKSGTTATGTLNMVLTPGDQSVKFYGNVTASGDISSSLTSIATFGNYGGNVSGSATSTGSFGAGIFDGNVTPTVDNNVNLGSAALRWANVYTADLHLNNEGNPNTIDGTTGNWTVQEGEDYIYVVNNKSNKKFKLVLEEIE